jgi:hypothetical protein
MLTSCKKRPKLGQGGVVNLSKGDILIDRKTLKSYPILDVVNGHAYLELGHRKAKRALGQIIRHAKKFIHLKVGQKLDKEYAFYCPRTDRMIVLKEGTIFLGEV